MPVVAVVAGIAGAAAAAGTFTLAAGFTLANVAAGMAIVGGISTALGAVTGNKKLMKFGAIVGLGGAALGGLSSLSGAASKAAGGAVGAISPTALTDASLGGIGSLSKAGSEMVASGFSGGTTGLLGSVTAAAPSLATASYSMSAPSSSVLAPANTAPSLALKAPSANPIALPNPGSATSGFDTAKGMLSDFGKYLKDNPELTKVGLGAMDGMSKAKASQNEFEARQRQLDADRARFNASILNQSSRL